MCLQRAREPRLGAEKRLRLGAFLATALCVASLPASSTETVVIEPGARYRAGWLSRVFFGAQWRHLWTTPIEVPLLDLGSFDGGLTPIERGGGLQTKNLHLD